MSRKYSTLFAIVLFFSLMLAWDNGFLPQQKNLLNFSAGQDVAFQPEDPALAEIYQVQFPLEPAPMGTTNTYVPVYKPLGLDGALTFFSMFGLDVSEQALAVHLQETDTYYRYLSPDAQVDVYKLGGIIRYNARFLPKKAGQKATVTTDGEALLAATTFIDSKFLFLSYEETEVRKNPDDGLYTIRFLNRIGNIKNYAFATEVTVDAYGRIATMDYYDIRVQRLDSQHIKSMHQAFAQLPLDFPEGTRISLNRCELVYVYENSIVQPAYLFEGQYPVGNTFQCFIPAAVFA